MILSVEYILLFTVTNFQFSLTVRFDCLFTFDFGKSSHYWPFTKRIESSETKFQFTFLFSSFSDGITYLESLSFWLCSIVRNFFWVVKSLCRLLGLVLAYSGLFRHVSGGSIFTNYKFTVRFYLHLLKTNSMFNFIIKWDKRYYKVGQLQRITN